MWNEKFRPIERVICFDEHGTGKEITRQKIEMWNECAQLDYWLSCAKAAMEGLAANPHAWEELTPESQVHEAWKRADAMLAEARRRLEDE